MNIKEAEAIVGGLSKTSKMPTMSISLPATLCKTGSKLRKVKGSVCSTCYALKGCYGFKPVQKALEVRFNALNNPEWVNAMVTLLETKKRISNSGLFRWHDSGDLQGIEHLQNIIEVAKRTPQIKHWIPTKEKKLIRDYVRTHTVPDNVVIRLSGAMIDGEAPEGHEHTSTVTSDHTLATCHAYLTDKTGKQWQHDEVHAMDKKQKKELDFGHCGECRKCWNKDIKNIVYLEH
jgi:hypothetical protein